jgi:uncharacterized protein (DUF885 family)
MLTRRELLRAAGASGALVGLGVRVARPESSANALGELLATHAAQLLSESPQEATSLGLDSGERAPLKSRLDEADWTAIQRAQANCAARLKDLGSIDRRTLNSADTINYDAAVYGNQLGTEAARFKYGDNTLLAAINEAVTPYVVSQQTGAINSIPDFLDSQHKIDGPSDADAYLARLEAFPRVLDQQTERVRHDAAIGVIPPDFILAIALTQINGFRAMPAAASSLVSSIGARAAAVGAKRNYIGAATQIVGQQVYPAIDRQIAALNDSRRRATHAAGVWRLPEGSAYYAWALKVGTSTSLTAEEVHQLGLEQTQTIGARMNTLLRTLGLIHGTVSDRMMALRKDAKNQFPDSERGRADLIAYLNERIATVRGLMPTMSRLALKAPVVVKRVPVEVELGQPLGYMNAGTLDGSQPSVYYINLHDMTNWPRFTLPSLTYHETIPGHVWQGAFITERNTLPLFNRMLGFNAYVEGWALYAEQMADEIGLYDGDPLSRLGYLQLRLLRAARLVADTGIHAKRWSREKAQAWLAAATGAPSEAVTSEVDRYCAIPGQACGYTVGQRQILRLREKAQTTIGSRFDLRDFNDAVISAGTVPLAVLSTVIDAYIAARATDRTSLPKRASRELRTCRRPSNLPMGAEHA